MSIIATAKEVTAKGIDTGWNGDGKIDTRHADMSWQGDNRGRMIIVAGGKLSGG